MSWDISVCKFGQNYQSVADIPATASILSLGARSAVSALISQIFTGTVWDDPSWGVFDSAVGSIEFNMGTALDCQGFMMHVRASEAVVPLIVELCKVNQWQGIDCQSGEFIEKANDPSLGLQSWQDYRAKICGDGRSD